MKHRTLILTAFMALTATMLASCEFSRSDLKIMVKSSQGKDSYRDSDKWGKVTTKPIDTGTDDITSITVDGSADVDIEQAESISIEVEGNEKAIDGHAIEIKDDELYVYNRKDQKYKNCPSIKIKIKAPNINKVTINGAGDVDIEKDYTIDNTLNVTINGAGDVEAESLTCENMNITIHGAGDMNAKKVKCKNAAEIQVSGAGDIKADIEANSINASISGAGDANLKVDCNNLYASVSGTGDIVLKGKCINFKKHESAKGSIDSRSLKYSRKN